MVYAYGWGASYHIVIWGRKAPLDCGIEEVLKWLFYHCKSVLFLDVKDERVRRGTTSLYWSLGEPKRYTSPSPYREYSSYSAEGKVPFLRRKKRLYVVFFSHLCTWS